MVFNKTNTQQVVLPFSPSPGPGQNSEGGPDWRPADRSASRRCDGRGLLPRVYGKVGIDLEAPQSAGKVMVSKFQLIDFVFLTQKEIRTSN